MHRVLFDPTCSYQLQDEAVSEALAGLFRLAERGRPAPRREAPKVVERAQDFMRDRLTEPLRIQDIADAVELDQFRLIRAFREHVGLSPYEWLTQLRVQRARRLLEQGLAAADVAQCLGYCDQSQLHRHFRRIVGVTPGAYARKFESPRLK